MASAYDFIIVGGNLFPVHGSRSHTDTHQKVEQQDVF